MEEDNTTAANRETQIDGIQFVLSETIKNVRALGTNCDEITMTITKLREAQQWLMEAERVIVLAEAKARRQTLEQGKP